MKQIYYDNSATTSVDERVLAAMLPYFSENYGNPNSLHSLGQTAQTAIDESREKVANFFGCNNQEIVFTSGATESNNLAIQGVVNYWSSKQKDLHIITTKIEHPAVLEVCAALEKEKKVKVDYLDVDSDGVVNLNQLKKLINGNTVLVSIMYANNEVGAIQPLTEIKEIVLAERKRRGEKSVLPIYFHTDAVQAINYLNCRVGDLGIDFLSFSGHKIYAPKGIGGLYIRQGVKFKALNHGGHHEYGIRPGTLNVPGIVGLGVAMELIIKERKNSIEKIKKIKNKLIKQLETIENIRFNGEANKQLPNIINVSFLNAEGESILMMLDMEGIAVSTGSACSSGSLEPSHVLMAMGRTHEWAHGSVRISLGKNNTEVEAGIFIKVLKPIIKKLREMAP